MTKIRVGRARRRLVESRAGRPFSEDSPRGCSKCCTIRRFDLLSQTIFLSSSPLLLVIIFFSCRLGLLPRTSHVNQWEPNVRCRGKKKREQCGRHPVRPGTKWKGRRARGARRRLESDGHGHCWELVVTGDRLSLQRQPPTHHPPVPRAKGRATPSSAVVSKEVSYSRSSDRSPITGSESTSASARISPPPAGRPGPPGGAPNRGRTL